MDESTLRKARELLSDIAQRAQKLQELVPNERDRKRLGLDTLTTIAAKAQASLSVPSSERDEGSEAVVCSFCGKARRQVKRLLKGPSSSICDECITFCSTVLEAEQSLDPSHQAVKDDVADDGPPSSVRPTDRPPSG